MKRRPLYAIRYKRGTELAEKHPGAQALTHPDRALLERVRARRIDADDLEVFEVQT